MARALTLALALSATDAFAPATTQSPRVAPMKMVESTTMPYSTPTGQAAGAPLGLSNLPKPDSGAESTILVQGGSLRTWSYRSPLVEQVQVVLSTEGRPLDADLELWHGPDNTPCKMRVYVENGQLRPFSCVIATPRGPNTVAIRNIGQIEFPIAADVYANDCENPSAETVSSATTIQGGALRTYPFDPLVNSVVELYTEDGLDRPFFAVLETPGSGNVVRIVNTAPVEFPMTAAVVPHSIDQDLASGKHDGDVVIGGDIGW
ncbi:hypothetical protein JL720_12944 [Aureococcus anophagefferens]|nr:hypothetical protein JL720_12944 [Aureococcus anophagefferens]